MDDPYFWGPNDHDGRKLKRDNRRFGRPIPRAAGYAAETWPDDRLHISMGRFGRRIDPLFRFTNGLARRLMRRLTARRILDSE